jgi:hypothetical protein
MAVIKREFGQFFIFSGLLLIGSLLVFPSKMGIDLGSGIIVYAIFEIVYYALVLTLLKAADSWLNLFRNAGLTFVLRISLGTLFGLCISLMFSMNLSVALTLGISRYLPAVLIHIIFAPFALRPLITDAATSARRVHCRVVAQKTSVATVRERSDLAKSVAYDTGRESSISSRFSDPAERQDLHVGYDTNGFERAVKYLGEHHAVILAVVVDHEGLTMAAYKRGDIDPDEYAPLSLLIKEKNVNLLNKWEGDVSPDRIDIVFGDRKLSLSRACDFYLLVMSKQEMDDLLGIRVTQAVDIIRRYVSERYGELMPSRPEEKYVPSA